MGLIMEHIEEKKQSSVLELVLAATDLYLSLFLFTVSVFINWHLHVGLN